MGTLEGKAVVVTGSGRGLGRAYAMAMAREGARVVVNDIDGPEARQVVAEITAAGGAAFPNDDDVTDWPASGRIIQACVERFGGIDVLVNNAGILRIAPVRKETPEEFIRSVNVSLLGTFNCTRHALDRMLPKARGVIINVSSDALQGSLGSSGYSAAKAGVAALTYVWAGELARFNIRVNAIVPFADTRMAQAIASKGTYLEKAAVPPPEAIAPLAVFLASDASWNVTGQVIRLDGTVLGLFSQSRVDHSAVQPGGWTAQQIAEHFHRTLGGHLQPVGMGASHYQYYAGLDKPC